MVDPKGVRSDFSLKMFELTEDGIVDTAYWNNSVEIKRDMGDNSLVNKTFVVMIALVSKIFTCYNIITFYTAL